MMNINENLTYKNYACKKYINVGYPNILPIIYSTSTYFNPITNANVIILYGDNFREYSTLRFGNVEPSFVFISSQQIEFYVPSIYSSGTHPIQLWGGNMVSNIFYHLLE